MKKLISTLFLIACLSTVWAQLNIELLARRSYGNVRLSNIWGWTAPNGTEYALVGTQQGVSIVSLQDPRNPREVATVAGSSSIWREIKTFGNHAYVVTDQPSTNDGLLIIDLSTLPDSVRFVNWRPTIPGLGALNRSHTLFIDEKGVCYLFGSNLNGGGPVMVDVKTNPKEPVYLGLGARVYVHDGFVRNDTMYAGEIYEGRFAVYDVSDKTNVRLLATQQTPGRFTHNTWLSDDGNYLYTTDEVANAPVGAYVVSDLSDIQELDQFRRIETLNQGVVPHNVHVKGDFLVTAYYTDGVNILDASRPNQLIEVGHFDTYPGPSGGFNGAWGVYPYFPSGNIVVSDIQNGLYVLKPTYVKASRLEGIVTDSLSGQPVADVIVQIQSTQQNEAKSNLTGAYQTGQAPAGTFSVVFSKPGYYSKTIQANLQSGEVTTLNVRLLPRAAYQVSGRAVAQAGNVGIAAAKILVVNDTFSYAVTADANGNFDLNQVIQGTYDIYAGAWGYRYQVAENIVVDNNKTVTLRLTPGYEDNFLLDLGWETFAGEATTGLWVRAVPVGTLSGNVLANPNADVADDLGNFCYVTGNGGGTASNDDVDGGPVTLVSPAMNLQAYQNPVLHYQTWFYNGGGNGMPNDSLVVRVTNGVDTVTVERITESQSAWRPKTNIELKEFINAANPIKVIFETSDAGAESHLLEGGVDGFAVTESSSTSVGEPGRTLQLQAFPNPFKTQLTVRLPNAVGGFQGSIRVFNALGQVLQTIPVGEGVLDLSIEIPAPAGVYWLQAISQDGTRSGLLQVVKR